MNAKTNKNINYIFYIISIVSILIFGFVVKGCYDRNNSANGNNTSTDGGNTQTESEYIRANKQLANDLDAAKKTNNLLNTNIEQLTQTNNHLAREITKANVAIESIKSFNSQISNAIFEIKQTFLSGETPEDIIDAATEQIAAICKVLANSGNK